MKKQIKKILFFLLILSTFLTKKFYSIESHNAIVISKGTGRILYNKNAFERVKMASLTKVMTSLLLVENCDMSEEIIVNPKATTIGGSKAGLISNDKVTAKSLLYGMLLPSGNDCAIATAYHIGGSIEGFADLMNKKAYDLGLNNTHFTNPHGLDNDEHYSSAYDLAKLTRIALSYPEIAKAVNTKSATIQLGSKTVTLNNTNRLLKSDNRITGVKTGFTNGAGRCLITSAKDNEKNMELICVVLGCDTTDIRFNESEELIENTFNNYNNYSLEDLLHIYIKIPITKGKQEYYEYAYIDTKNEVLTKEEYSRLQIITDFENVILAPTPKGTYIGNYSIILDDEIIYSKDFYLPYDILKKGPIDYFILFFKEMFNSKK